MTVLEMKEWIQTLPDTFGPKVVGVRVLKEEDGKILTSLEELDFEKNVFLRDMEHINKPLERDVDELIDYDNNNGEYL